MSQGEANTLRKGEKYTLGRGRGLPEHRLGGKKETEPKGEVASLQKKKEGPHEGNLPIYQKKKGRGREGKATFLALKKEGVSKGRGRSFSWGRQGRIEEEKEGPIMSKKNWCDSPEISLQEKKRFFF